MATRLFVIEDTFSLSGREGTTLIPGFSERELAGSHEDDRPKVTLGACIELRRPDGSCLTTRINGIDMPSPNTKHTFPIVVPLPKDQIPVGTQVWLTE